MQSWEEMAQADNGKFCTSCNKPVIDFSNFTEQQLQDFFSKINGRICGNFRPDQINRTLSVENNNQHKYFIPQLLVSTVLTIGLTNKSVAKEIKVPIVQIQSESLFKTEANQKIIPTSSADSLNYINGKIIDNNSSEPLPFARIFIKGINNNVESDAEGNFKLAVPDTLIGKEITLVIAFVGYQNKEMQVSIERLPLKAEIRLTKADINLRGVVVHEYYVDATEKKTIWQKLFGKKQKKQECK